MSTSLLAFALPLASMLAVANPPAPAPAVAFHLPSAVVATPRARLTVAELQAMPAVVSPGHDGPWMFEGPVWSAQPRQYGPVIELGALGGGHAWAPDIAHVSLDWQF